MATALAVDTSLVLAARGDQAAFAELYNVYGQRIYNYVLRSVREPQGAEDVCQEVWVKAYRRLRHLHEPAAFSTWLYRIASRACIDHARKHAAQFAELPDDTPAAARDRPDEIALRTESERLVWEALGSLPVRQHQALYLRAVEGRSYKEIATILEASESAIETLLFRARNGVAEAYDRLEARAADRCALARRSMRVVIDGDANAVQRNAVGAHVDGCRDCRTQLFQMRRVSAAYAALPLFPLPPLLAGKVLHAAAAGTSAGGLIAKLIGLLSTKAKLAATALTISGGIAATAVIVPSDVPVSYVGVPAAVTDAMPARPLPGENGPGGVVPQAPIAAPPLSGGPEQAGAPSDLTELPALVLPAIADLPTTALPELPVLPTAVALPPLPLVPGAPLSALPAEPLPLLDALPPLPLDVVEPLPTALPTALPPIAPPLLELPPLLPLPESTPLPLPELPPLIDLPPLEPLPDLPLIP